MVALSFSCYPIHLGGRVTHKVFSPVPFVAPAIFFYHGLPDNMNPIPNYRTLARLLLCTGLAACTTASAAAAPAQRERILINADWRFQMGDPAGTSDLLRYDVRPEVKASEDGKAADAVPDAAVKAGAAQVPVLKPWILPTGNAFIRDPARRHQRPAQEPKLDVAYLKAGYDDSAWKRVNLPHDWAIAGPFLEQGPYGGVGRLPSWGIGWYRKQLAIPASDKGRSIFLDVEGACPMRPSG